MLCIQPFALGVLLLDHSGKAELLGAYNIMQSTVTPESLSFWEEIWEKGISRKYMMTLLLWVCEECL